MEKKIMSIEMPFFVGFYGSRFYNSDDLYWELKDEETMEQLKETYGQDITDYDVEIRWDEFTKDVCDSFIEAFKNYAPDFVEGIEYDEMTSPREYNYSTDRLYCNVTLADDWKEKVLSFMENNKEWLSKKIKNDWTSYDGFMSFMDNDYDEWYNRFVDDNYDERYVASMIAYMMKKENKNVGEWVVEDTMEEIYLFNYLYCPNKEEIEKGA